MNSYSVSGVFSVSKNGENINLIGKSGEYAKSFPLHLLLKTMRLLQTEK